MKAKLAAEMFGDAAAPIVVGPYEIVETLGAGGMGVVHAGWDDRLGRRVAIKVLPAELLGEPRERARLQREARALAQLSHPNVVQVYEVGEHEGDVFIAMELVEGVSLRQWQADPERTASELLEVYDQAGRGLAAAHRAGLVHRDFKPANVHVGADGRARVLDFGLALGPGLLGSTGGSGRSVDPSSPGSVTRTGLRAGTPAYMAPEQLAGDEADARADQFSFCVALYEALAGRRPFEPAQLRRARGGSTPELAVGTRRLPLGLRRAVRRGLCFDPSQRWPSMDTLLHALGRWTRWRRRLWTWGAPLSVASVATAVVLSSRSPGNTCGPPVDGPAAQWAERAPGIRGAMLATRLPFGAEAVASVDAGLERFVVRWDDAYVAACGEPSAPRSAVALACLERGALRSSAVLGQLARADIATVTRVDALLDGLGDPATCLQTEPAAAPPAPPEVLERLEQARVSFEVGHFGPARKELEALVDDPRLTGTSTHVELLELLGRVLGRLDHGADARRLLLRAAALPGADPRLRAQIRLDELALAIELEQWSVAEYLVLAVTEVVRSMGDPPALRAQLLDLRGRLALDGRSDPTTAIAHHEAALDAWGRVPGDQRFTTETKVRLANGWAERGAVDRAQALYREALDEREARVGR
ncbi:MAG: serine/threonine-protein kinase, partial [Nannocystaceae bacterium]